MDPQLREAIPVDEAMEDAAAEATTAGGGSAAENRLNRNAACRECRRKVRSWPSVGRSTALTRVPSLCPAEAQVRWRQAALHQVSQAARGLASRPRFHRPPRWLTFLRLSGADMRDKCQYDDEAPAVNYANELNLMKCVLWGSFIAIGALTPIPPQGQDARARRAIGRRRSRTGPRQAGRHMSYMMRCMS